MAKELVHSFEDDLPEGWATATIGDLISPEGIFIDGDWVESKDQDPNGDVRLIQLADIADGYYKDKSARFLTKEKALKLNCTFLEKGDVLIARMPDPLGRACIFPGDAKESVTVVDVCVVRTGTEDVNHKWLMYWVNSPRFRNTIASLQSGTTRKRISRGNLATITFPVPPSEQQKRIVAKIEELFSHIDAGIEALKKAKQLLKQYRQSVLKAAVTGKLTEQWRADRKAELDAQGSANAAGGRKPGAATKESNKFDTAQELLDRILKERRLKWEEQQLEQFKAKGKMPKDDKWKEKYVDPQSYDGMPPFGLPTEWTWVYLGQLGEVIGGLTKNKKREQLELQLPYLRVANVYANELRLDDVTNIGVQESELERVLLEKGDLLVVEGNGSPEQIGRLAIWDGSIEPCVHQNHLIKVRLQEKDSGNYLMYWLSSLGGRSAILQVASSTSGLYTLSISKVSGLPIPLPPIDEQIEIHYIVSSKLSSIDHLENDINVQLMKAEKNKQSILASAFSGNLGEPVM